MSLTHQAATLGYEIPALLYSRLKPTRTLIAKAIGREIFWPEDGATRTTAGVSINLSRAVAPRDRPTAMASPDSGTVLFLSRRVARP